MRLERVGPAAYNRHGGMKDTSFDEVAFFRAIARSGARALLIGRRALVLLGLPVLTADYDFWLHLDDVERFNAAAAGFDLAATHSPEEARQRGRYVLENGEHVDVLVARSVPTVGGIVVPFEEVWSRRQSVTLSDTDGVTIPSVPDLILTKQFAARPKDLEDIRMLHVLARSGEA